jgi:hypothetical protein
MQVDSKIKWIHRVSPFCNLIGLSLLSVALGETLSSYQKRALVRVQLRPQKIAGYFYPAIFSFLLGSISNSRVRITVGALAIKETTLQVVFLILSQGFALLSAERGLYPRSAMLD